MNNIDLTKASDLAVGDVIDYLTPTDEIVAIEASEFENALRITTTSEAFDVNVDALFNKVA